MQDFIHSSDPFKSYKLRVVDKLKREGNTCVLKEVIQHIKISATTPAWFGFILPIEGNAQTEDDNCSQSVRDKYFSCSVCDYSTNHHCDLGKHIRENMVIRFKCLQTLIKWNVLIVANYSNV